MKLIIKMKSNNLRNCSIIIKMLPGEFGSYFFFFSLSKVFFFFQTLVPAYLLSPGFFDC